MCGRFTYSRSRDETRERFGVKVGEALLHLLSRYNVAPTQTVLAVGQTKDGGRKATALRWGLIPSWAKEAGAGSKTGCVAKVIFERGSASSTFARQRSRTGFRRTSPDLVRHYPLTI